MQNPAYAVPASASPVNVDLNAWEEAP
jgi:hypothetical protein